MKLLLREYLSSLRERDELDALMPALLSELGSTVLTRPRRGTRQFGVDFAAVGPDETGERKVYLFSIKAGDLGRGHWADGEQALRPSLDEIQDVYVPRRIPLKHRSLKVVICICFGGEMLENVQDQVEGYTERQSTERLSFEIWNGDRIAGLLLDGVLREDVLPADLRTAFRKAVAMVDEPDVALRHFQRLVGALRQRATTDAKSAVTAARQAYIALWTLYVWGREANNIEAPYQASELCVLLAWEFMKPYIGKKTKDAKAMTLAFNSIVHLHLTIATSFISEKILPHADKQHGLSLAIGTRSALDVNLRLFEVLGRLAMVGLWRLWMIERAGKPVTDEDRAVLQELVVGGLKLINNNPALCLPIRDDQAVDIALFLLLWWGGYRDPAGVDWIGQIIGRLGFTLATHGRYTCNLTSYADLATHPSERSESYRKEATGGSTLIPLLATWCVKTGAGEALGELAAITEAFLPHCSLQTWIPDETSEAALYVGGPLHGMAISGLPLNNGGTDLVEILTESVEGCQAWPKLSAVATGYWPIVMMACRRHRLPVPPQFWIAGARRAIAPAPGLPAAEPPQP